jgi:hypothetical protein
VLRVVASVLVWSMDGVLPMLVPLLVAAVAAELIALVAGPVLRTGGGSQAQSGVRPGASQVRD